MDLNVKKAREEFVSGHGGSSPQLVVSLCLLPLLSILASHLTCQTFPLVLRFPHVRILLEHSLLFGIFMYSVTVFHEQAYYILAGLLVYNALLTIINLKHKKTEQQDSGSGNKKVPALTIGLAGLMSPVMVAILAVDFPLFPRWLCKTEDFGTSLMDVGVGCFICMNGMLSRDAREPHHSSASSGPGSKPFAGPPQRLRRIRGALSASIPLLVLGLARFTFIYFSNYQSHASEYGLHWNFFFTLAITKTFGSIIWNLCGCRTMSLLVGIFLLACYQLALYSYGLAEFIHNETNRSTSLVAANKEGLASLVPSIALHLLFIECAKQFAYTPTSQARTSRRNLIKLSATTAGLWACAYISHHTLSAVSRREHNLAFACWTAGLVLLLLLVGIVMELIFTATTRATVTEKSDDKSLGQHVLSQPLFQLIGRHALVMFLIANLITGLCNLSMDPMSISSSGQESAAGLTLAILFSYTLLLTVWAYVWDYYCRTTEVSNQGQAAKKKK